MFLIRFYDRLIVVLACLAALTYAFATGLIIVDVLLRNFGLRPIQSASALVEYVLLFATMASGPWLLRHGAHVAINSFVGLLPSTLHRLVVRLAMVISLATLVLLSWRAALIGIEERAFGAVDMRSIDIPMWIAYALLSGGLGLMAIEVLRMLVRGNTSMGGTASH